MYAVIQTGGKQYRVEPGQIVKLAKMELETGQPVNFNELLLVSEGENVQVGTPYLAGAKVTATIVEHGRDPKIKIIKFRRRKHHMKQMGHRQDYTKVQINNIEV